MHIKPKKLGITQLPPDLFVLTHKINHEMFRNSPSIPPATKPSTVLVGVSWRF
ncbi:hypothetical protein COO91_05243 [Nostoc flagelliforme CCNUN1]|uniref:Uncharacterized protein n=1 Tax=Nostoc flagelliforme CCNUN1 TaxID=2038116 RepID=A0A2K8STK8_9NOSO|nr:hypothetical protein COO91_04302 [Nostoc flagelliforme CCNUN1]AUB38814.1 hypothetical protein COO91_04789 [Nostoc flagelliforme CCNUN1]AUB39251.1 hypothetical protein COO91_05243 [Nostoc flagelliforme CCNUN1]